MKTYFTGVEIDHISAATMIAQEYYLERAQNLVPKAAQEFRSGILRLLDFDEDLAVGVGLHATVKSLDQLRKLLTKRLSTEPLGELRIKSEPNSDDSYCSIDPTDTGRALISALMSGYFAASGDPDGATVNAVKKIAQS